MSNWFQSCEAEPTQRRCPGGGLIAALEYLNQQGVFSLLGLVQMQMTLEPESGSGIHNRKIVLEEKNDRNGLRVGKYLAII